jgi:riboflavin kinase / FMN adenylyltransferase
VTLQVLDGFPKLGALGPSALTVGTYDGLHRGHLSILTTLIESARRDRLGSVMITFEPHPRCVLDPEHCPASLTTREEKAWLLDQLGLDHLVVVPFTPRLAQASPTSFMRRVMRAMELRHLVVGYNFAFGHGRQGDHAFLRQLASRHRFRLDIAQVVMRGGEPISSSRIRRLILLGQLRAAAQLLGRNYLFRSTVQHGTQRGHHLGYPTANLAIPSNKLVPPHGIYAVRVELDGLIYPGALYVGIRPTFGERTLTVEVFLFDFDGDLYGRQMSVWFVQRLRGDRRFATPHALQAQMAKDVENAKRVLSR